VSSTKVLLSRVGPILFTILLFIVSLHVSRTPDGSLLPVLSFRTLWISLLSLAALGAVGGWVGAIARRRRDDPIACVAGIISPLGLLALYPLAVFIFHPLKVPLPFSTLLQPDVIMILAGGLALFRLLWYVASPWKPVTAVVGLLNARSNFQWAFVLFFGFLMLYGIMIKLEDRSLMLVGDEPHYMLMMESMRRYQTADLTRILESNDPLPHGVRKLRPHTSGMSVPGTRYEVHNIGISLLMMPGFTLVGYKGAVGVFAFVAALLAANMFLLGVETTGRRWTSLFVAVAAGLSAPFIFYFRNIYPEMPAALCLIYAVRVLRREQPAAGPLLLAGAGAAFMPWCHVKFVIMSAILAGFCAIRHRRSWRTIICYLAPHLPIALILMYFFHQAYGSWMPNAQYGDAHGPVSKFFFRGAPGLLLDRDHGLLAFAPMYWLVLPGLVCFYRTNRAYFTLALVLALPSFVILASHWMWWGGPCPPARFILPLIPLFVPAVVAALSCASSPVFRLLAGGSIALTLALSAVSLKFVNALPFHEHFLRKLVIAYDAFPFFPLFFIHRSEGVPREHFVIAAFWIAAWCCSLLMLRREKAENAGSMVSTLRHATFRAVLTAGVLILIVPGVIGYANARLFGVATNHPDGSTRPLAHMNVVLDAYTRPFARAGVFTGLAEGRVNPYAIYSRQILDAGRSYTQEELDSETRERSWIFFGRYTTLYPVNYTFTFTGEAESESTGDLILFDICNDLGRNILWKKTMDASSVENGIINFALPFRPDGIKPNTEFRAAALAPGSYRFEHIKLEARLP